MAKASKGARWGPGPGTGIHGSTSLEVVAGARGGVEVRGLRRPVVTSVEAGLDLLSQADAARAIAEHALNERSTRSHCIVTLHLRRARAVIRNRIETRNPPSPQSPSLSGGPAAFASSRPLDSESKEVEEVTWSKMHLVDLAGSERVTKSGSSGRTLVEATHINQSLSALQHVVLALGKAGAARRADDDGAESSEKGPGAKSKTALKQVHVPYRNSVLTRYLQDSLGGNCRTRLVACLWPSKAHAGETRETLRFAGRMLRVRNRPVRNVLVGAGGAAGVGGADPSLLRQLKELRSEVRMLRQELSLHDELNGRLGARHGKPREQEVKVVATVLEQLLQEDHALEADASEPGSGASLHPSIEIRQRGAGSASSAAAGSSTLRAWDDDSTSSVWELRTAR